MKSRTENLTFDVPSRMEFFNIAPQVEEMKSVKRSVVREVLRLVNAMRSTSSVFINDDELWLAALLGCSPRHVYRLADRGRMLGPVKLGVLVRWGRSIIDSWLADG